MIRMHVKGLTLVFTSLIILSAAFVVMGVPQIISWGNSKTNNDLKNITVDINETVLFNATTNENVTQWSWFVDSNSVTNNLDNFNYKFISPGSHSVNVRASNGSQVFDTITWNINVRPNRPAIISRSNNKTGTSDSISINISEIVIFYATPDQQIDTWNWYIGSENKGNTPYNFSYPFNTIGNYTVRLTVSNTNGTSDPVSWNV